MKKIICLFAAALCAGYHANAQLGIYDIQGVWGINFVKPKKGIAAKGYVGTDYDLGVTFLNIPYMGDGKGPSAVAELHYDYSRQNFDGYLSNGKYYDVKFRRHEVYTRIRPITFSPSFRSYNFDDNSFLSILLGGFYVDLGYTKGNYFFEDAMDNISKPTDSKDGFFWGWGYNVVMRSRDRFGVIVGYGSKIYNFKSVTGAAQKYSSRSFHFGLSYSLVWKD